MKRYVKEKNMHEPIILSNFSNTKLVDFEYHIDKQHEASFIRIKCQDQKGNIRKIQFNQPFNLKIEEGFRGSLAGMAITDISSRQWGNAKIEVINFEQDPGITFLAMDMVILTNKLPT